MKIIKCFWFSGFFPQSIGIVLCENDRGKRKAYIGPTKYGNNETQDAWQIAEFGARLDINSVAQILEFISEQQS